MTLQDRPDYPGQPCPIPGHGWKWIPRDDGGWECSDCRFDPPKVTTYEEWRVTGDPGGPYGLYEFVWDPARHENPEAEARGYLALLRDRIAATGSRQWIDGPHLHRRTVTVTEWEAA